MGKPSVLDLLQYTPDLENLQEIVKNLGDDPESEASFDFGFHPDPRDFEFAEYLPPQAIRLDQIQNLNRDQQDAIKTIKLPFEVIHGPPGTGKSTTIVGFIASRIPKHARVLICTTTNKAIDSLTSKIAEKGFEKEILAVGRKVESASQKYLFENKIRNHPKVKSFQEIENLFEKLNDGTAWRIYVKREKFLEPIRSFLRENLPIKRDMYFRVIDFIFLCLDKTSDEEPSLQLTILRLFQSVINLISFDISRIATQEIWEKTRYIVCTASTSVKLILRLSNLFSDVKNFHPNIDYLILDEAGAMHQLDVLGALISGPKMVVMVGDHLQLRPVVENPKPRSYSTSYDRSLLEVFQTSDIYGFNSFFLGEQYRMPTHVCYMIGKIFYEDKLTTSNKKKKESEEKQVFLRDITEGGEDQGKSKSFFHAFEIEAAIYRVEELLGQKVQQTEICVLSFYSQQAFLLKKCLAGEGFKQIEVATVDSMQGREKDHVILSCVRTKSIGFLSDRQRTNVALSRCKKTLTIIGHFKNLRQNPTWREVLDTLSKFDFNQFSGSRDHQYSFSRIRSPKNLSSSSSLLVSNRNEFPALPSTKLTNQASASTNQPSKVSSMSSNMISNPANTETISNSEGISAIEPANLTRVNNLQESLPLASTNSTSSATLSSKSLPSTTTSPTSLASSNSPTLLTLADSTSSTMPSSNSRPSFPSNSSSNSSSSPPNSTSTTPKAQTFSSATSSQSSTSGLNKKEKAKDKKAKPVAMDLATFIALPSSSSTSTKISKSSQPTHQHLNHKKNHDSSSSTSPASTNPQNQAGKINENPTKSNQTPAIDPINQANQASKFVKRNPNYSKDFPSLSGK